MQLEVSAESGHARTGEDAKASALVVIELCTLDMLSATRLDLCDCNNSIPGGASRQKATRSSRRNSWTPDKLRCGKRGQLINIARTP